jgi:hypothetical protein
VRNDLIYLSDASVGRFMGEEYVYLAVLDCVTHISVGRGFQ